MRAGNKDIYQRGTACIVCGLPVRMHKRIIVKICMAIFYPRTCRIKHQKNKGLLVVESYR